MRRNKRNIPELEQSVKTLTYDDFVSEVLQSDLPVLVDFYADWCGPCRALAPVLAQLSAEFAGKAKIVKVNADHEPELAEYYQVQALPTLMLFRGGRLVQRFEGAPPAQVLRSLLNQTETPRRVHIG
jgi:thioredoxin